MGKIIYQPAVIEKEKVQNDFSELPVEHNDYFSSDELEAFSVSNEVGAQNDLIEVEEKPSFEEIYTQASEEGFAEGKKKGFSAGQKEGYQAGLQEGKAKAVEEVEQHWQPKLRQLSELISTFTQKREEAIDRVSDEFVPVVFSAVAKIVGELALSPEFVQAVIKQALQGVRHAEQIIIKLHPDDARLVSEADLISEQYPRITIVEDDSILAGCVIETNCGNIDAQLDTQLTQLKMLLSKMRTE